MASVIATTYVITDSFSFSAPCDIEAPRADGHVFPSYVVLCPGISVIDLIISTVLSRRHRDEAEVASHNFLTP